jgi:hypothetical protein
VMQVLLDLVTTLQFLVPQGNYDDRPTCCLSYSCFTNYVD